MMAGHALLAFALAASGAAALGWDGRRALAVGAVAAAFAAVPDVDMAYALVGVARAGVAPVAVVHDAFWDTGLAVHRAVTHSLVLAVPAATAFALAGVAAVPRRRRRRAAAAVAAAAFLGGLVAATSAASGGVAAAIVALYAAGGVAVAAVAVRRAGLGPPAVLGAALVGLLSHPFGDVFTGQPPAFLYPVSSLPTGDRVALAADPTLNLLAVFGLELATAWLALAVYCRLSGRSLAAQVDRRVVVGAAYAVVALTMPPPTMDVSYHFVFSVLGVGAVGAVPLGGVVRWALARRAVPVGPRGGRPLADLVVPDADRNDRDADQSARDADRNDRDADAGRASPGARPAVVRRLLSDPSRTAATALGTVTVAALAYAATYLAGTPTFL